MSIKKILAASAASIVAASAMAVVASAAEAKVTIPAKADGSWSDIEYKGEEKFKELFGDDYANLDTVTIKAALDGDVFGYGFQSNGEWTQVEANPGVAEATITDIKTSGDDCCIKFMIDGAFDPVDVIITWTTKGADSTPDDSKPEESKTDDSKTDTNTNVNTGVEGVAAVVGVAAIAAGAMIVAKKRK